jgi:hypothetical protein
MKIVVVDEQRDVDCGDEECYEIDAAEFAKKVNLNDNDVGSQWQNNPL